MLTSSSGEHRASVSRMSHECRENVVQHSPMIIVRHSCDCRKYVLITLSVWLQCENGCNVAFLSPKLVSNWSRNSRQLLASQWDTSLRNILKCSHSYLGITPKSKSAFASPSSNFDKGLFWEKMPKIVQEVSEFLELTTNGLAAIPYTWSWSREMRLTKAHQPANPTNLFSAFVFCSLDRIIVKLATCKVSVT